MSNGEIIAELHRIAAKHDGILEPADVVDAARSESSPLHSKFEWDDSVAAEKYRLYQARQLLIVTVDYIGTGKKATLQRVFVSLTTDRQQEGGGYRAMTTILADKSCRAQLLEDAFEEMRLFREKYAQLKELTEVFEAMRKVRRNIAVC